MKNVEAALFEIRESEKKDAVILSSIYEIRKM